MDYLLRKKINKEEFEKVLEDVLKYKKEKEKNKNELINYEKNFENRIKLDYPFLNILSKLDLLEDYSIYIKSKEIENSKFKNEYSLFFSKIYNKKYPSIEIEFTQELNFENIFQELKINQKKIKILNIYNNKTNVDNNANVSIIFNNILNSLFSLKDLESLIYLEIKIL